MALGYTLLFFTLWIVRIRTEILERRARSSDAGALMSGFLALGQYAAFIWSAYGVSAFGIVAAVIVCWRGYARAKARLAALEKTAS